MFKSDPRLPDRFRPIDIFVDKVFEQIPSFILLILLSDIMLVMAEITKDVLCT